jgi:hypothetical protein
MKESSLFLLKLKSKLISGQILAEKFRFVNWLNKSDGTQSLQFSINKNYKKSIPEKIIVKAKIDFDKKIKIDEDWFKQNDCNRGWCPPLVMNFLLKKYK